jgi:signal transduction histidine kinase
VNNVIKHSGASQLDIALIKDKDGISATIEDNGKGFDLQQLDEESGIGLKNMKARIDYFNGTIDFDTAPGKGTLVALFLPLTNPQ